MAKKAKPTKAKKPYQTVSQAAARLNAPDFVAFMSQSSQETPLMRFADYFETAFSAVSAAQFSWVHMFRNRIAADMTEVWNLASGISRYFYTESEKWISSQPTEDLSSFVEWCLERIFADLKSQQFRDGSAKSVIGIFVALALVLKQRPSALLHVSSTLRETSDYHDQDILSVVSWMIALVYEEDMAVGLYLWAHNLVPLWNENHSNPVFRSNVLDIMESIFHVKNYLSILQSGAIGKGERLIPPFALKILIGVAHPPSSARIEDDLFTSRFEKIFPHVGEVALSGCEPLKEEAREMIYFAIEAAREGDNDWLRYEGSYIFAWCLSQNVECYSIWDELYLENIKASINILKHMSESYYWDKYRVKLAPLDHLRETLKNLRQKNEAAVARGKEVTLFEEADKYCKIILKKSSGDWWSTELLCFFTVLALLVAWIASLAF